MEEKQNSQKHRNIPHLEWVDIEVVSSTTPVIVKDIKPILSINERKERWMARIKRWHAFLSFVSELLIEVVRKLVPVSLVLSASVFTIGFIGLGVVRGIQWIKTQPETPYIIMGAIFVLLLAIVFVFHRNGTRNKIPFDYEKMPAKNKANDQVIDGNNRGNINIQINQN